MNKKDVEGRIQQAEDNWRKELVRYRNHQVEEYKKMNSDIAEVKEALEDLSNVRARLKDAEEKIESVESELARLRYDIKTFCELFPQELQDQ